jgi:putative ABC transport system substrate-binding protein
MPTTRRQALATVVSAAFWGRAQANPNRFAIVAASREGPHAAAIEGIEQALSARSIASATFQLPADEASLRQALSGAGHQVTIAVGAEAVRTVSSSGSRIPLLATMVFRADMANAGPPQGGEIKLAGAVWLDLPIPLVASGLREVFPDASRFALVHDPSQPDTADDIAQIRQLPPGISVRSVECGSAADLLTSMRKLRGQVEFVICRPDSTLYNKTTVEPLILASLEHKLPLVGYSASFVRAGAALGVYPNFNEIGRQSAALAERCLTSPSAMHEEYPRRTTVAANERVLHLLGRSYKATQGDVVLIR